MGCHSTHGAKTQIALDDSAGNGLDKYCSPRHRMLYA
jgi:hypothetical protein